MARALHIEQIYAFVTVDPADNIEGILSFMNLPMVGADMKMVESLRPIATQGAHHMNIEVKLVRFEIRTELETINPTQTQESPS